MRRFMLAAVGTATFVMAAGATAQADVLCGTNPVVSGICISQPVPGGDAEVRLQPFCTGITGSCVETGDPVVGPTHIGVQLQCGPLAVCLDARNAVVGDTRVSVAPLCQATGPCVTVSGSTSATGGVGLGSHSTTPSGGVKIVTPQGTVMSSTAATFGFAWTCTSARTADGTTDVSGGAGANGYPIPFLYGVAAVNRAGAC